jgi:CheY-like chemotaxis protein
LGAQKISSLHQPKNVLVAEDRDGDFFMLKKAFAKLKASHALGRVRDGIEVLAYLMGQEPYVDRQRSPFPDLLIMDRWLPKLNGLEVLQYVRQELEMKIPIVILSGAIVVPEMEQAIRLGASECMVKPISFSVLVDVVKDIEKSWLAPRP